MTSTGDQILTAAFDRVAETGLARLSLEDVAVLAGVSRQTVYRYFGSRDGLLRALVLREEHWFVERVVAAAAPHEDVEDAASAGVTAALVAVQDHPLLQRLLREEPGEILPLIVLGEGPVISVARRVVAEILADRLRALTDQVEELADTSTRLLLSYVLDPGEEPPEIVGRRIARVVVALAHDGTTAGR